MSWTEDEDREKSLNQASDTQEESTIQEKTDKVDPNKEIWTLLEKTLSENLIEKRRARRWKIFFRFTTLAIFIGIISKSKNIGFWSPAYKPTIL